MNTNILELTMMQRAYVRPKWGLDYLRIISASIGEEGCGSTYRIGIYMVAVSITTFTSTTTRRTTLGIQENEKEPDLTCDPPKHPEESQADGWAHVQLGM